MADIHELEDRLLSNIVRLYRGEEPEFLAEGSQEIVSERFPAGKYVDVPGLCKVATLDEVAEQDWSLNPGRYVGLPVDNVSQPGQKVPTTGSTSARSISTHCGPGSRRAVT